MLPFGVCEQEAELQTGQILSRQWQKQSYISKEPPARPRSFCYVNDPNLFVVVAVFKCQVVDMSVVLNTSNREAEHQPPASRVLLETRRVCSELHFKQQLFDALNAHELREVGQQTKGQGH